MKADRAKEEELSAACPVHSVAQALAQEPALEAVVLDRGGRAVSLATLGNKADPELEERVTSFLARPEKISQCRLLVGLDDCNQCDTRFQRFERESIVINANDATTTIARLSCPTAPRFWRWKKISLPKFAPRELEIPGAHAHGSEWKWQLAAAGLCGTFGLTGYFSDGSFKLAAFLASYLAGGWFAAHEVWELLRKGRLDIHFLMLAVAAGSAIIDAWAEGAALLFLFSLSGALEHYAMGRTQKEISALFKAAPKSALQLDLDGTEKEIPVDEVQPGMRLLVKPDSQFPVDAEVLRGSSAADESNLTGESAPVEKNIGDPVFAGTLNLWGAIEVSALKPASESALEKVIQLIQEAQRHKAPTQRFTDKFGTPYTYAILVASLLMFLVWRFGLPFGLLKSHDTWIALYRSMTLLVVASPCALVLSIPSAVLAAIASGARRGILFRGGAAVENLAAINVVALDKTGTLTTGELKVDRVESFPPGAEEKILQYAFSLERFSNHPLARAITRFGKKNGVIPLDAEKFEALPGLGVRAECGGKVLQAGRASWACPSPEGDPVSQNPGLSEIWVAGPEARGRILLRDEIRPQARAVLNHLQGAGLQTLVLTGDRSATGKILKMALSLEDVRTELKPEEKVKIIQDLGEQGNHVAMIGDGVNDAPSLAAASVGIAMGARGSDSALEQADVILMHDRIENFWEAFLLSRRAKAVIRQNLVVSLGTVVVLVTCAVVGAIPLTLGVVGHEGSTVLVVLNSLRLLVPRKG